MADVRVVVVTYFSGDSLAAFLDSLPAASTRDIEVVVADNGSTDGAPEAAASRPGVTLLRTGGNLGYGRAANAGAVGFDGEWLVVANPDIVFTPGSLDALIDATARWPTGGAFGPGIRTPDGELYPSARQLPALGRGIGHALLGWWWPANPWTRAYRQEATGPVEGPTGWLSGSLQLLRDATRGGRSAVSTSRTSCTARTWTWATGSARRAGSTSTCRPPSSATKVGTPPGSPPSGCSPSTIARSTGTCRVVTPACGTRRCARCWRSGWPPVSRSGSLLRQVREGARPTRSASELDKQ